MFPESRIGFWCRLFGKSRQAYYKHQHKTKYQEGQELSLLADVMKIRRKHPMMGTGKLRHILKDHPSMRGRDRFYELLSRHDLLIRKHKRHRYTTQSNHIYKKYPNRIKGLVPERTGQVWVSDITYVKVNHRDYYLSLITDAYSRKIVGYSMARNLDAKHSINALRMAIEKEGKPSIHHSDRGIQYCCYAYTNILQDHEVTISMSRKGDPLENPLAERVNGIIKNEYLYQRNLTENNYQQQIQEVIELYNKERPHLSWNMKTPNDVHFSNFNSMTTDNRNKNQVSTFNSN